MKLLTILFSVLLLAPAGAWAQGPIDGGDGPFGGGQAGPRDTGLPSTDSQAAGVHNTIAMGGQAEELDSIGTRAGR